MIWDLFDILLCAAVSYFLYWRYFTYYRIGAFLGISGIVIGGIDMFLRNREPIFTKILLLIFSGLGLYVYGYFLY
ncbi:MAG: hypothetical protein JW982_09735 [Spirochaetes bacterium]|nr:hypothetical protein [Spirochaetota bacterium]